MAAKKNLNMVFGLEDGKNFTYSLADPKDGITRAEVVTVMNDLITNKIIMKGTVAAAKIQEISVKKVDNAELE